jgi:hypothetical protein
MCWASARCKSQFGPAVLGLAGQGYGAAGRAKARRGLQTAARRGNLPCCSLWEQSGRGGALRGGSGAGAVRRGEARCGVARAIDGGTEGFGSLCHPHQDGYGRARWDEVRHGQVGPGEAWQGMDPFLG